MPLKIRSELALDVCVGRDLCLDLADGILCQAERQLVPLPLRRAPLLLLAVLSALAPKLREQLADLRLRLCRDRRWRVRGRRGVQLLQQGRPALEARSSGLPPGHHREDV